MTQQPIIEGAPGIDITFAEASAAVTLRPMKYRCKGIDENAFHALPGSHLSTLLPWLRGRILSFDEYSTLGKKWRSTSCPVFYAQTVGPDQTGPPHRFALKVAFNVHGGKNTFGGVLMDNLRQEAIFYNRHLKKIQGSAVPKHYGVWIGWTAWGTSVACAIMEWCGQPYDKRIIDPRNSKPERRQRIMDTIKALHDVGFEHTDLGGGETDHLLYDTSREMAFIIDFRDAEKHKCGLRMELLPYTCLPMPLVLGCEELCSIGQTIGYFGKGPFEGPKADIRVVKAAQELERELQERDAKQEAQKQLASQRRCANKENQTSRTGVAPFIEDAPGVAITFAHASAGVVLRPIRYRCKNVDENTFGALPNAHISTLLPRLHGKMLSYEKYSTLGTRWQSTTYPVFYAEAVDPNHSGPRRRFALKVAFNVHGGKDTFGGVMMDNLRREAIFYQKRLKQIQGIAVPKHYGVWIGCTAWGTTVACAIMEWCGQPYSRQTIDPGNSRPDRRQRVMEAIKALHDVGYEHTDLGGGDSDHLLYDTEREMAFLIDFCAAEKHKCGLKMKLEPYTTLPLPRVLGCIEFWRMGKAIGYFGKGPNKGPDADIRVVKATEEANLQLGADEQWAKTEAQRRRAAAAERRRQNMEDGTSRAVQLLSGSSPSLNLIASAVPISQGAEAKVYKAFLYDGSEPILIKHRFPKQYRHSTLDGNLTRSRVAGEARNLLKSLRSGVNVPGVRMVDAADGVLGIEWVDGISVRRLLPGGAEDEGADFAGEDEEVEELVDPLGEFDASVDIPIDELMGFIGIEIAKMHSVDVVHGDLTTSNMMLRRGKKGDLVLIDFGLSYQSTLVEDKAVDLYVLERAFASTHPDSEPLFASVLTAYGKQMGKAWTAILKRLEDVRLRGRKRSMLG
ncbi:hypothetical protein HDZ31DRAFT_75158 [Schizophyllum fasciatum]